MAASGNVNLKISADAREFRHTLVGCERQMQELARSVRERYLIRELGALPTWRLVRIAQIVRALRDIGGSEHGTTSTG